MPPKPTDTPNKKTYPHDIHPGLVPGISVEDQRRRFGVDRLVFGVTAVLIISFIAWGIISPQSVSEVASTTFSWAMTNTSWLLTFTVLIALITMVVLAFSRFGTIRLGTDGEKPEFSRFSWISMMFGAGIGVGIFFFGPSEPLSHYLTPPPETVAAETPAALHQAMAQSHFHYGIAAWALYALVGAALAYSSYRKGRRFLFSSAFTPLLGEKRAAGVLGRIIDITAIIATLFGTAATLGLSAMQISRGVAIIAGSGPLSTGLIVLIIGILSACFIISAVSGVARGVRYLSNINITLTMGFVVFVFLVGPTLFLLNLLPSGLMQFVAKFPEMMGKSLSWGEATLDFQAAWTTFYWAWWIAFTPFVGSFIARISKGRTLREFTLAIIAVPSAILAIAFTVFGGMTITLRREGDPAFDGSTAPEQVLFDMFDRLPLAEITPFILLGVLAIFFITSADSASVVMGTLSSKGDPKPKRGIIVFWGLCMMGIAMVMLISGGEDALTGTQQLTILIAVPFSVVLLGLIAAFIKDLSTDPAAIRRTYAHTALRNAVYRGIEEHGDDFELSVREADAGQGAGADFDSTAEEVTDWYQRTDENGHEVGYDYRTGQWADGYPDIRS